MNPDNIASTRVSNSPVVPYADQAPVEPRADVDLRTRQERRAALKRSRRTLVAPSLRRQALRMAFWDEEAQQMLMLALVTVVSLLPTMASAAWMTRAENSHPAEAPFAVIAFVASLIGMMTTLAVSAEKEALLVRTNSCDLRALVGGDSRVLRLLNHEQKDMLWADLHLYHKLDSRPDDDLWEAKDILVRRWAPVRDAMKAYQEREQQHHQSVLLNQVHQGPEKLELPGEPVALAPETSGAELPAGD